MKKILIVDDDDDILDIVKHLLTSHGFNVQTHSTGLNVPEVVTDYNPNLILLDICLPGKSGTEICKELKQLYSDIRIILFSAQPPQGRSSDTSDAEAFIKKPFDAKNLVNTVRWYMN